MLETLKYKNHLNEVFDFGKDGIFINYNDLHDYKWTVDTKGSKITSFSRGVQNKKLPVVIMCESEDLGIEARNKLHEVAEKDVLAKKPGKIILGDYYMQCFISESVKSEYLSTKQYMKAELKIVSDQPFWVKESTTYFTTGSSSSGSGKNYPNNYPYNYSGYVQNNVLLNSDFVASNFRMIIYGAVTNPEIFIAGHSYKVNVTLESGSYLIIDSVAKTIKKITSGGSEVNVFSSRNRSSYIFEKIPSGSSSVSWSGSFAFDVIILEERSEPLWI